MKCRLLLVILAMVLSPYSAAIASDFSKMADPTLARLALISETRRLELNCASLALSGFEADGLSRPLSREQAKQLGDILTIRLGTELGATHTAEVYLMSLTQNFTPYGDREQDEAILQKRITLEAECQTIFDAAKSGQLVSGLQSASAAPLPLPDIDTCLAYDLIAQKDPEYEAYSILKQSDDTVYTLFMGPKGKKRDARKAVIAQKAQSLLDVTPKFALSQLMWPCLPVYVEEMKKNGPTFWGD